MKKNIYSTDTELIESKLNEIQGRCKERLFYACDCDGILQNIYCEKLHSIPKKYLKGTTIILHASMDRMPQAYKYPATETSITFTHDGKGWKFIECNRDYIKPSSKARYNAEVFLSDTAKQAILDSLIIV